MINLVSLPYFFIPLLTPNVTDKPKVYQITLFIDTTYEAIKTVTTQKTPPEFQKSLLTDNSVLILSILGLIALILVSNMVLYIFASPLRNALCSSAVTSSFTLSSTLPIRYTQHNASPWKEDCPILVVRWSYIAPIAFLEPSTLFQAALDTVEYSVLFSYGKVLAALKSRALRVATLLVAVALGYNIEQIAPTDNSFWFTSSPQQITRCARIVRPWFFFKESILWAICYFSEFTSRFYSHLITDFSCTNAWSNMCGRMVFNCGAVRSRPIHKSYSGYSPKFCGP
jgi:hypothetical protein